MLRSLLGREVKPRSLLWESDLRFPISGLTEIDVGCHVTNYS